MMVPHEQDFAAPFASDPPLMMVGSMRGLIEVFARPRCRCHGRDRSSECSVTRSLVGPAWLRMPIHHHHHHPGLGRWPFGPWSLVFGIWSLFFQVSLPSLSSEIIFRNSLPSFSSEFLLALSWPILARCVDGSIVRDALTNDSHSRLQLQAARTIIPHDAPRTHLALKYNFEMSYK